MFDVLHETLTIYIGLLLQPIQQGLGNLALQFVPFALFLEFPLYGLIIIGVVRYSFWQRYDQVVDEINLPTVACIVICYGEGDDVKQTIRSLAEQLYRGSVEILVMIDGATQNPHTYKAAKDMEGYVARFPNRTLRVVPKWQRGGRVSSMNLGLELSRSEIVMALDGDTSFDNDMVYQATRCFSDENVVGVAGNLRVQNGKTNIITLLQELEYLIAIYLGKTGLSEFNIVNNISGAFGIHRRSFLEHLGGWDCGTAEDLDLTLRIKGYFGRYPDLKITFAPLAIGHTNVPDSIWQFLKQRLRWDGDLSYLYFRKHSKSFSKNILGPRNLIAQAWYGLLFQVIMPFLILFYMLYIVVIYPFSFFLGLMMAIYTAYLLIIVLFFSVFLLLLSERVKEDLKLLIVLPLFPLYAFFIRIWSAVACSCEFLLNSHRDSSMAPWWVLKKTKF